jgi:nodulation protein E
VKAVHVTGIGITCATGAGKDAFAHHLREGLSGIKPLVLDRVLNNRIKIAGSVPAEVSLGANEPNAKLCDRFALLALMAAREAIAEADLHGEMLQGDRTAVLLASGIGGMNTIDDNQYAYYKMERNPDPLAIPKIMPNAAASQICMALGIRGPSFAISSACSSSTQAIGLALQLMRAGIYDRVIVGGSEALITPATMRCWEMMRVLCPEKCQPFGKARNGMVIGEGAGVLVIETQESLLQRGVPSLGLVCGYGTTSDAGDLVKPDPLGAANAMQMALDDAQLSASQIGYINAHGTGTILNDRAEAAAINQIFGPSSGGIPVSSTKPVHGHCLGSAGAIEAIATLIALNEGFAPATLNTAELDAACDINVVCGEAQPIDANFALTNNFAFGGINASLIFGRAPL